MKIRTDFVTNSSSTSYAEVVIDNPVLLEILLKYEEMGAFGDCEVYFHIGTRHDRFEHPEIKENILTPAFFMVESEAATAPQPRSLKYVLTYVIEIMDTCANWCGGEFNREVYTRLKEELLQREKEIKAGYLQVIWIGGRTGWGHEELEIGDECDWVFLYDPENGERFSFDTW